MTGVELLAIGTAVSAATSVAGAVAASNQQSFQADLAKQNSRIAQRTARAEEANVRRDMSRRMGALRAAVGASGIEGSGAMDVIADQAQESELHALLTRFGGLSAVRQHQAQAATFKAQRLPTILSGLGSAAGTTMGGISAINSYRANNSGGLVAQ